MTHSASRLQASANSYHFHYVSLLNALVAIRDGNSLGSHWRPFFEVPFPVLIFSMTGSRSIIISCDDPTQRAVRSIFGIVRRRNLSTETSHQRFWLLVVVCKRHRVCLLAPTSLHYIVQRRLYGHTRDDSAQPCASRQHYSWSLTHIRHINIGTVALPYSTKPEDATNDKFIDGHCLSAEALCDPTTPQSYQNC